MQGAKVVSNSAAAPCTARKPPTKAYRASLYRVGGVGGHKCTMRGAMRAHCEVTPGQGGGLSMDWANVQCGPWNQRLTVDDGKKGVHHDGDRS